MIISFRLRHGLAVSTHLESRNWQTGFRAHFASPTADGSILCVVNHLGQHTVHMSHWRLLAHQTKPFDIMDDVAYF